MGKTINVLLSVSKKMCTLYGRQIGDCLDDGLEMPRRLGGLKCSERMEAGATRLIDVICDVITTI